MKVLTVRQPWAWLLFEGKNIENRDWFTCYRGLLAIHAAKGMTRAEYEDAKLFVAGFDPVLAECIPLPSELIRDAIIGTMRLRTCVLESPSPWFQGKYGWTLDTPEACDPVHIKGSLGLWNWDGKPCSCCHWEKEA